LVSTNSQAACSASARRPETASSTSSVSINDVVRAKSPDSVAPNARVSSAGDDTPRDASDSARST